MSPISALFFFLLLLNPTSAKSIGDGGSGGFGNGLMDDPMLGNIAQKMFSKFSSFLSPSNNNDLQVVGSDDDYYDDVSAENITKIVEEKIRQCTCAESKECIIESYRTLSICRQSCKMHLEYFGAQSSEIAECFPKNAGEAEAVNQCLKKDAPNFCSKDSAPKFITKPTYDKKSLSIISELDIAKLTGISIIEHWNAFHTCADSCLKKKMIECFENKKCGIQLPSEYDLAKIADFCLPIKNARKQNVMKTFSCFTIQRLFAKFLS
uniref:Uncharacterized protein n=1 Tax=Panagrolaimus davidi TaxID=227884 RepID=A0A914QXP1_9BILA